MAFIINKKIFYIDDTIKNEVLFYQAEEARRSTRVRCDLPND